MGGVVWFSFLKGTYIVRRLNILYSETLEMEITITDLGRSHVDG
jgi:hypothetical protein